MTNRKTLTDILGGVCIYSLVCGTHNVRRHDSASQLISSLLSSSRSSGQLERAPQYSAPRARHSRGCVNLRGQFSWTTPDATALLSTTTQSRTPAVRLFTTSLIVKLADCIWTTTHDDNSLAVHARLIDTSRYLHAHLGRPVAVSSYFLF